MSDDIRSRIIQAAESLRGIPYQIDPPPNGVDTIDCSLFVLKAYEKAGIPLGGGIRTAEQIRQAMIPVEWPDVKPGDALFFEQTYDAAGPAGPDGRIASHIGLSLGAGTHKMWNSLEPVSTITDISGDWWQSRLLEARRAPQLAATTTVATLRGIDVASHQGAVNWPAVAAAGYPFGFSKATGGTWYRNPTFAANWLGMKAAGVQRGAYHYAFESSGQPLPGDGPEAEAEYFVAELKRAGGLATGDLVALDIEEGNGPLGDWALRWCERVEVLVGFAPFVYTGAWFTNSHGFGSVPGLMRYPLWLAAYQATMPSPVLPWSSISIWQNTDALTVPGINGLVDGDLFNGTVDQLRALGKPGAVAPVPDTFVVGDGIRAAMKAVGDSPASDEMYTKRGDKDEWSEAYGRSGSRFVYIASLNKVFRYPAA